MMPRSAYQCHAIGCSNPLPFGILFCLDHEAWKRVRAPLIVALADAHQRFYRVEAGQLVRNLTGDPVQDASIEAAYTHAVTEIVVELARLEGKALPAEERAS